MAKPSHPIPDTLPNLGLAISTLYSAIWSTHEYDRRLRGVLAYTLRAVKVQGIFVLLGSRNTYIELLDPRFPRNLRQKILPELWKKLSYPEVPQPHLAMPDTLSLSERLQLCVILIRDDSLPDNQQHGSIVCAACFERSDNPTRDHKLNDQYGKTFLPLVADVMRHRERRFNSLPERLSQHYWEASAGPPNSSADIPPWDRGPRSSPTATLSIDMRKSTKAMEQAHSRARFADWLDELVQIISDIAHRHGGIFDKFTGDGALVHFLQDACIALYNGKSATVLAIECAREIHRAIYNHHLPRLREILHIDFKTFGIGAAVASSNIHWKLDYRDNPITVGRGVVEACRLCTDTPATFTTVTNLVFQHLRRKAPALADVFKDCDFISKEIDAAQGAIVYRAPLFKLLSTGGEPALISEICHSVYKRTRARRSKEKSNGKVRLMRS
jgi:class 3 adenylate cyclase